MKNDNFEIAQITAVLSFVIGTILFALYLYLEDNSALIGIGIVVIIIAILWNGIVFLITLGKTVTNKNARLEGFKTCLILLANIPISILYFFAIINSERFFI